MRRATVTLLVLALLGGGATAYAAFTATTTNPGNSFSAAAAFGGMRVQTGFYTGNNTDNRNVVVGFQPAVVIVKGNNAQNAVARTASVPGDLSKPLAGNTAPAANMIQAFGATTFQVGTSSTVNAVLTRYDWIAFSAYPKQLAEGLYTGNGSSQSITGLGFSPDYVIVAGGGATPAVQRSACMSTTFRFDETAATANGITSLDADGFSLGSSPQVNTNGTSYLYVAWNEVGGLMSQGSYTGDGYDNRSITGVGFQPDWVSVRSGANGVVCNRGVHRTGTLTAGSSQYFANVANLTDAIQNLEASGFQVGTNCRVNANGSTYYWTAFRRAN